MTICVVGSGAREHALALSLAHDDDVIVAPGNPGMTSSTGKCGSVAVSDSVPEEIDASLFVIGPEAPLVKGLADRLRAQGKRVFGPGADGARLEGSKAFMKEVLGKANVPTAAHRTCTSVYEAVDFLKQLPGPFVIKTDGLAAGKGVLVTESIKEAEADVVAKLSGDAFGPAGQVVVIEEGLIGTECSLHVLCDGKRVVALPPAQDFKRVGNNDTGPNTGGMGSYSPVPDLDQALITKILTIAVLPLVGELCARHIDYRGVLYAGIMLTKDGPYILEYNTRFGDPETQVIVPPLAGGFATWLGAAADGDLSSMTSAMVGPKSFNRASVCVVAASMGYPTSPVTGDPISGLRDDGQLAEQAEGVTIYHAGTAKKEPGAPYVTAGGRVLGVTALGSDLADARKRSYSALQSIFWHNMVYRQDIAEEAANDSSL